MQYVKLSEVITIHKGSQLNVKEMLKDGIYPVINGGTKPSGYWNFYNAPANTITVCQGGSAGYVDWQSKPFWAGTHCYWIETKPEHDLRFIYFLLKKHQNQIIAAQYGAGSPSLKKETILNINCPLINLSEQLKIVKFLNTLTELETRKKQNNYYLNLLVDYKKPLLCSNVLKVFTFNELLDYVQPTKFIREEKSLLKIGEVPVLTPDKIFILGYSNVKNNIYKASSNFPIILFDDFTCAMKRVDFPFLVKSSACKFLKPKNLDVNFKFLYYALCVLTQKVKIATHERQWIKNISQVHIALPELIKQNQITKFIDVFDSFCFSTYESLPKEINLRKNNIDIT